MKIRNYISMLFLATALGATFNACSDDEILGDAPRLFRPVATIDTELNKVIATWDNIAQATNYDLELYKVISTDEAGNSEYELYQSASCEESPYTFSDLNWDEKYMLKIKCNNADKKSAYYETDEVTINYPSKLSTIKVIDIAARVNWKEGGNQIKMIIATPEVGDPIQVPVSEEAYRAGHADVDGLSANTPYTISIYSNDEVFNNTTYEGKMKITTTESINFDEAYGAGKWLDMRACSDSTKVLQSKEFWAQVTDGMTVILKGEYEYQVNNSIKFDRSVTFITGATLGGNALFLSGGGMQCASGATINEVKFINIDMNTDLDIVKNTDKSFGGKQVFNNNGTKSTLKKLIFKGCTIEGYRAVVRVQADNDNINEVTFEGCTINGVGDQGVVTTNNKASDMQNISFTDCTITNIITLADLRAYATDLSMNITNCTFCYAPIETTANANTPLLRFGSKEVALNVSKTLFGPSMATEGSKGSALQTYTAGTAGSIFLNGTKTLASVGQSFKTNFDWTEIGDTKATYPLEGLNALSMDEKALWQTPNKGDFKVMGNIGESGIGASKWQ